jgi:hypothetical protein
MLVIGFYAGQTTQIRYVCIDRYGIGNYINATLNMSPHIQSGKLVSNSATTLPTTYNQYFHSLYPRTNER